MVQFKNGMFVQILVHLAHGSAKNKQIIAALQQLQVPLQHKQQFIYAALLVQKLLKHMNTFQSILVIHLIAQAFSILQVILRHQC